ALEDEGAIAHVVVGTMETQQGLEERPIVRRPLERPSIEGNGRRAIGALEAPTDAERERGDRVAVLAVLRGAELPVEQLVQLVVPARALQQLRQDDGRLDVIRILVEDLTEDPLRVLPPRRILEQDPPALH